MKGGKNLITYLEIYFPGLINKILLFLLSEENYPCVQEKKVEDDDN